jgi:hypothetical protein
MPFEQLCFIITKVITDIYNIRTLSVNIKFICTSFRNRQNSEPSARFSGLLEYNNISGLSDGRKEKKSNR